MHSSPDAPDRRTFLARIITTIQAAVAGTLGVVLGGSILSPMFGRREERWLPAARLTDLIENRPVPVTLRVAREDGYSQVIERRTVFLVRTGDTDVMALDSTCTHLGCRVSWDAESQELKCPCHGGVYDTMGQVKAGPPPGPLVRMQTRVSGNQVQVQI
jgi:nitrite reductase/ring-hydroxylating ferredoxin subunit